MFSQIYSNDLNEIQKRRLEELKDQLQRLQLVTLEDFQAEFYSALNAVLDLGNDVTPIRHITPGTPALAGHVQSNLAKLNQDASAIATQLLNLEQQTGQLFNLYAATQNGVRQSIREQIYAPTTNKFLESFINGRMIDNHNGSVDYGSGAFYLPLTSSSTYVPSQIRIGESSVRAESEEFKDLPAETELKRILDSKPETNLTWIGPRLELVFTFDRIVVLNRLQLEMDQYQGLVIEELTSSPDGVLKESLFDGLNTDKRTIDGFSGKFSSDYYLDFLPRHVKQLKLVIADKLGEDRISIRNILFFGRRYASVATLTSKKIENISGTVLVTAKQEKTSPLTSITHQISYDGVGYQAIPVNTEIEIDKSPFWYRIYLERMEASFDELSSPVIGGSDPDASDHFTLHDSSSLDLGNGILERRLHLTIHEVADLSVTRAVRLREHPFSGSLEVWISGSLMSPSLYTISSDHKAVTFVGTYELTDVMVKYQTSAFENAGLKERKEYYTPYVEEISFEKQV